MLTSVSLSDKKRIREIVGREFAWADHAAQSEGYNLPTTRVFAHLSKAGYYNELVNGVTSYQELKKLALNYGEYEDDFIKGLQEMASLLFNRNNIILTVTGEEKEIRAFTDHGSSLVEALPAKDITPIDLKMAELPRHEAFITSAEIVFAVQGGNLLPQGNGYSGHFEVLKTYLSRDYLWNNVRQLGGAYGCFVQFSNITGNLAFVSYRDPQVKKTSHRTFCSSSSLAPMVTSIHCKVLQQKLLLPEMNISLVSPRNISNSGLPKSPQQVLPTFAPTLKLFHR